MTLKRRQLTSRPMSLRHEAHRQLVARLLFLGWTAERIARKLHCTVRSIRHCVATPEFQTVFADYQREQLATVDHRMAALLAGAVDTLDRLLKHPDWRARDAAVEKILRIHGRYIEKLDLVGRVEHHHTGSTPEIVMSDATRAQLREALTLWRQQQPRTLPSLVTRNGLRAQRPAPQTSLLASGDHSLNIRRALKTQRHRPSRPPD